MFDSKIMALGSEGVLNSSTPSSSAQTHDQSASSSISQQELLQVSSRYIPPHRRDSPQIGFNDTLSTQWRCVSPNTFATPESQNSSPWNSLAQREQRRSSEGRMQRFNRDYHHHQSAPGSRLYCHTSDDRKPLKASEVVVGSIIWVCTPRPGDEPVKCIRIHECNDSEKGEEGLNHPAVVLRIRQREGSNKVGDLIIDVSFLTSFGDIDLQTYKSRVEDQDPGNFPWYKKTMPICFERENWPYPGIGDSFTEIGNDMLYLEAGKTQKQSYVHTLHIFAVPIAHFCTMGYGYTHAYDVRLNRDSYVKLMRALSMSPDFWEDHPAASDNATARRLQRCGT